MRFARRAPNGKASTIPRAKGIGVEKRNERRARDRSVPIPFLLKLADLTMTGNPSRDASSRAGKGNANGFVQRFNGGMRDKLLNESLYSGPRSCPQRRCRMGLTTTTISGRTLRLDTRPGGLCQDHRRNRANATQYGSFAFRRLLPPRHLAYQPPRPRSQPNETSGQVRPLGRLIYCSGEPYSSNCLVRASMTAALHAGK